MRPFKLVSGENLDPTIRAVFHDIRSQRGFVPNLFRVTANSAPSLLALFSLNHQCAASSFSSQEKEVIALASSVENDAKYCAAAHSQFAETLGLSKQAVLCIREKRPLEDPTLEALRQFTVSILRNKGHATAEDLVRFFDAGFTTAQAIEIILGITLKTLTNFISSMTAIPIDEPFMAEGQM